jgi:hypothetical protein
MRKFDAELRGQIIELRPSDQINVICLALETLFSNMTDDFIDLEHKVEKLRALSAQSTSER